MLMITALALAAQAAPAPRVPAPVAADARCIVVMGYLGSRGSPEQVAAIQRGILYFVGKLRGRDPRIDLARTVTTAADAAKAAGLNARDEAQRCSTELEAAGAALAAVRNALTPAPPPVPTPAPTPTPTPAP